MTRPDVTDSFSSAVRLDPGRLAADEQGVWCEAGRFPFFVHVDAATNAVAGTVDLPFSLVAGHPGAITDATLAAAATLVQDVVTGFGALWVAVGEAVVRLDPITHDVTKVIGVTPKGLEGRSPALKLTVDADGVWVAGSFQDVIRRIDPSLVAVTHEVPVRRSLHSPLAAYGSIWMLDADDGPLCRLDPATGSILAEIDTGGRPFRPMRAVGGSVLLQVGNHQEDLGSQFVRIDPATNTMAPVSDRQPSYWYVSHEALWAVDPKKPELIRLDPRSGDVVARIDLKAHWIYRFAHAGGDLWVGGVTLAGDPQRASLLRIDTSMNRVSAIVDLGDVEIPERLLPTPPPRLSREEFDHRVLAAVRADVLGRGHRVDPRTGQISSVPFYKGISVEEVTFEVWGQNTCVDVLFRSAQHPGCIFGWTNCVPYDPAAPSHDPEEEAGYLTLPLREQLDYGFLPQECDPDENGITWV